MSKWHPGPGFTQRPEIPEDRFQWRSFKPWVTWKNGRRRYPTYAVVIEPSRGLRHDPEKRRAKRLEKRRRQGKEQR